MKVRFQRIISLALALSLSLSCVVFSASAAGSSASSAVYSVSQSFYNDLLEDWYLETISGKTAPESYSNPSSHFVYSASSDVVSNLQPAYVFVQPLEIWFDSIGYTASEVSGETLTFSFVFDYSIDNGSSSNFYLDMDVDDLVTSDVFIANWNFVYGIINSDGTQTSVVGPAECQILHATVSSIRTSRVYLSATITVPDGCTLVDPYFAYALADISIEESFACFYRAFNNQGPIYMNVYDCSVTIADDDDTSDKLEEIISLLNTLYTCTKDLKDAQQLATYYLGFIIDDLSYVVDFLEDIDMSVSLIYSFVSAYLYYLEDILASTDDINATLESELTSLNDKIDVFMEVVDGYLFDVESTLSDVAASNEEIERLLQVYLVGCWSYLIDLDASAEVIYSELESFHADNILYLDAICDRIVAMQARLADIDQTGTMTFDLLSEYLLYLEDILISTDNMSVVFEDELSSLNEKLDLYFELFFDCYADMIATLAAIRVQGDEQGYLLDEYFSSLFDYLLHMKTNINMMSSELYSFHSDFSRYFQTVSESLNGTGGISEQLDMIYELLQDFVNNYSSGNVTYEFPDGYVIPGEDGTEGEKLSFWDLARAVISGIWHVVTGAVTTFIGGLTGLISGISSIGGFFDFYRDGEVYDAIDYGGGDIWD